MVTRTVEHGGPGRGNNGGSGVDRIVGALQVQRTAIFR